MSDHTPEPWVFTERTNNEHARIESIKCACNIAVDRQEFSPEKTSANYRRIVLCVNSLAGVPDELLQDDEKNIINRYTEHLKKETVRQADLLAEVTAELDALKSERATILSENEALKNARNRDSILKERDYWSRRAEKAEAELEATKTAYAHMVKLKDELCTELEVARKQEPDSWRVTARSFCGTHTTDKEVAEEWLKTGDAYPLYASPVPAQKGTKAYSCAHCNALYLEKVGKCECLEYGVAQKWNEHMVFPALD